MAELKTKQTEANVEDFLNGVTDEENVDKKVLKELVAQSVKTMKKLSK